jgi:hypothetical protein
MLSFRPQRKVERQVKVLIKNLAIFFLVLSKIQNSANGNLSPKQKEQIRKQLGADKLVATQIWKRKILMSLFSDVFSLPVYFEYYAIFES